MFITKIIPAIILIILCSDVFPSPATASPRGKPNLRVGFYDKSCPQAEQIVEDAVTKGFFDNPGIAASLIRLHFHDCFVHGCDASILLDTTPSGEPTEKTSPGSVGLRGFNIIDDAKTRLEEQCPDTVSCADIIAFATRNAVVLSGLPPYSVPAGRRDGRASTANTVFSNIPFPNFNVSQMDAIFTRKGMNKNDLVTLLGAHSIGVAHCFVLNNQFYNYNTTDQFNPNLDIFYVMYLRAVCPPPGLTNSKDAVLKLNPIMSNSLSSVFYSNLIQGRVVIPADQSLLDDPMTRDLVYKFVEGSIGWDEEFRRALVKLGKVDVLTGQNGEIRRSCRVVNN